MIIWDPIYGRFEVPSFLDRLILAPEVRRLMGVRLLNTPSPSLPTLSEIRRFSHTLGVLHLALTNPHLGLRKEEVRALSAAILIHDSATPPLAHLLEYYLKDRTGWDHEAVLPDMLTGHLTAENIAHQILPGEQLKFKLLCKRSRIDFDIVLAIVQKQHRASRLLFGTLDFDNLDNVIRMAWAIGLPTDPTSFLTLAAELSVSIDGQVQLSTQLRPEVEAWANVRKAVYDILVFDEPTVASQAVLTKATRTLFESQPISDRTLSGRDPDFLDLLRQSKPTKEMMLRHFDATLPTQILAIQVPGTLAGLGFTSRDRAIDFVEKLARNKFGVSRPFGYVFVDRGTFSKRLEFVDPATREKWTVGAMSESVVFYCFANERVANIDSKRRSFRDALLVELGRPVEANADESRTRARPAS